MNRNKVNSFIPTQQKRYCLFRTAIYAIRKSSCIVVKKKALIGSNRNKEWRVKAYLNTDLSGVCVLAERIRKAIEENPHHKAGRVTVSAGAGMFREEEDGTSLLRRVDKALYAAKDKGRNRVEIAD